MTLKQLVPSLELCQRAQGLGWKKKTHFVWLKDGNRWYAQKPTLWHAKHSVMIPAPTLQEVLEELPESLEDEILHLANDGKFGWIVGYFSSKRREFSYLFSNNHPNPAEAALELWCELEERKVKNE